MSNKDLIKQIKLLASLLELHEANPFKIKNYTGLVYQLEKTGVVIADCTEEELLSQGFNKGSVATIKSILETGTTNELSDYLSSTPIGVLDILSIKGLGPKKVRSIWKELGIESIEALSLACDENKIANLKGFGEKTQDAIKKELSFSQSQRGKLFYADAEPLAEELQKQLSELTTVSKCSVVGHVRLKREVIEEIELLISTSSINEVWAYLNSIQAINHDIVLSGPFAWRGIFQEFGTKVTVHFCTESQFNNRLFILTGSIEHLSYPLAQGSNLARIARMHPSLGEQELYSKAGLPFIEPEMREGTFEFNYITNTLPSLITLADIRGILHNHSTYSDGKHSLSDMASYCKELGYSYLGISDHSVTAFYANGLSEEQIIKQHSEIEVLNTQLAPFKVFKGIESDILNDGSLDYPDQVLASFDFIIASIHSNLTMNEEKANERLITAIKNPFTTMLGHPTGRLLLKREGYPIDHKKIIDACAEYGVIIEINSNPWRLDLDWRWVRYALDNGVILSINPDAHEKNGYHDMQYGIHMARKGGAEASQIFNTWKIDQVSDYFNNRRSKALSSK